MDWDLSGLPTRFGASLAALLAVTGGLAFWTWDRFRTDERGHLIAAVRTLAKEVEPARRELAASLAASLPPANLPIPQGDPTATLEALVRRPAIQAVFYVSGAKTRNGRIPPGARLVIWRRILARVTIDGGYRCCEPGLDKFSVDVASWRPSVSPVRWLTEDVAATWRRDPARAEAQLIREERERLIDKILADAPWDGTSGPRDEFYASGGEGAQDLWSKRDRGRALGFVSSVAAWEVVQGYPILARRGLDGRVVISGEGKNDQEVFLGSLDPGGSWFRSSGTAPGLWGTARGMILPDAAALMQAQVGLAILAILEVLFVFAFGRSLRALLGERAVALAQSGLVSGVSHEMRTPLMTIKLYAEMLRDGLVPAGEEQAYCQTVVQESDRLSRLVENVLDYARISGRRRAYRVERADLGEIAAEAAAALAGPIAGAGMTLETVQGGDLFAEVDRDAMVQILVNLIGNAIKYASSGGKVTVGAEGRGGRVVLWVADCGPGIDKDESKRLFKPFYRGKAHAKSAIAGTGLGLALVAEHVKAHRGHLEIRGAPGRGATFVVTLPREHGG